MKLSICSKNNKGFTLIELLSIIIVLAIIAVVTIPELLGMLDEARLDSAQDSAYSYRRALQGFSIKDVNFDNDVLVGSFTVDELKNMGLETGGHNPDGGIVLIDKDGITGCLEYNDYISILYNDDVVNTTKGVCPKEKLVTSGSGLYKSEIDEGRFIYRGAEPNNWILLDEDGDGTNETLYRIISYEADGSIKVIRDGKIDNHIWDSTLITYLNEDWNVVNVLSKYISEHYFYSGILNYPVNLLNAVEKSFEQEKEEEKTVVWNVDKANKVGLTNITEHVESSTNTKCKNVWSSYINNTVYYDEDGVWPCSINNWMIFADYTEWTLTVFPENGMYWDSQPSGVFSYHSGDASTWAVRPTFYLKSGIKLSGNGVYDVSTSEGTPYEIIG